MNKGWIVTKNFCTNENCKDGKLITENFPFESVNIIGPRNCTLTKEQLLEGNIFRMFDDDDNLYFEGYLVGDKNSHDGFMPLDNYGSPDSGCTYIKYKNKKGEWVIL